VGRATLSEPLEWFQRHLRTTAKQRRNWRLIGGGIGIHWEDVDEDILEEGGRKIALQLHRETTMTPSWIAERLRMATNTHLAHLLYWQGRKSRVSDTKNIHIPLRTVGHVKHVNSFSIPLARQRESRPEKGVGKILLRAFGT
jgi:hypothetical protein